MTWRDNGGVAWPVSPDLDDDRPDPRRISLNEEKAASSVMLTFGDSGIKNKITKQNERKTEAWKGMAFSGAGGKLANGTSNTPGSVKLVASGLRAAAEGRSWQQENSSNRREGDRRRNASRGGTDHSLSPA